MFDHAPCDDFRFVFPSDEEIAALASAIDTVGFGVLEDAVPSFVIDQSRQYVEGQLRQRGGQYFGLAGREWIEDSPLAPLARSPQFECVLQNLYRHAMGEPAPGRPLAPSLRVLAGAVGLRHSYLFHYDSYVVTALVPLMIPDGAGRIVGRSRALSQHAPHPASCDRQHPREDAHRACVCLPALENLVDAAPVWRTRRQDEARQHLFLLGHSLIARQRSLPGHQHSQHGLVSLRRPACRQLFQAPERSTSSGATAAPEPGRRCAFRSLKSSTRSAGARRNSRSPLMADFLVTPCLCGATPRSRKTPADAWP